ncbi:MAG: putative transport system permease protein [Solirubrobacteraceae bacterium]|jgi:putative ABC transport system permease protein|nr:putative transport system permease protein [Solirubrobacteraceae bacterium]
MRPGAVWLIYRNRLRAQLGEELLAVFGIAVGVALVFAVLVANHSVTGSVDDLVKGIVGRASLELHARGPDGVDEAMYRRVARAPSVRRAAPALVRRVVLAGPRGRRSLTLLGGTGSLQRLGGSLVQRVGVLDVPAISLPDGVARPLGLHPGQPVDVLSGERRVTARVGAVLSEADIGKLSESPIVIAPLAYAQRLTGLGGRVTDVLVEPSPGLASAAEAGLTRVAGPSVDVRPSDSEARLMHEAAKSSDQSSVLFSAISGGIGLLFAYNAMLLTLPSRRRICAELRLLGFRRRQVLSLLLFETAILSLAGAGLGIALGDVLSRALFSDVPRYLTDAFAIGDQRIVTPATVVIACAVGIGAAFVAALRPLRELYLISPLEATHRLTLTQGEQIRGTRPLRLFVAGVVLLLAVTAVTLLAPSASLVAATLCALVSVAILPLVLRTVVRLMRRAASRGPGGAISWIAVTEIAATPTRATALAATAAVAVFGITTVEGARQDLVRGASVFAGELGSGGDLHLVPGGPENYLALEPFDPADARRRIARLPIVDSIRTHRGQLLDLGHRRLALFGRPTAPAQLMLRSELRDESLESVSDRLRHRGSAVVSSGIADEKHLVVGDAFDLPTASGHRTLRVAGISTNYFWPPGAIVVSADDYRSLSETSSATELMVSLRAGTDATTAVAAVKRALGPHTGLRVLTSSQRADEFRATARQAMTTLGQIRGLVLVCAVLAVAAAMGAAISQRRQRIAALKTLGFRRAQLLKLIVVETLILLTAGGVVGASLGIYGQAIATRWIELSSGSSVSYVPAIGLATSTLALVVGLATLAAALPARVVTGVEPRAALAD